MILAVAAAIAGPVLGDVGAPDAFTRCVAAADAEVDEPLAVPELGTTARIAVVVGVPCHRSAQIPSLQYSTRDATVVGHKLQEAGFTVLPLVSAVDRRALFEALDRAQSALAPGGELVVYFSGHGTLREEGGQLRRYLVLSDTDLGSVHTTGLAVRTLEERLSRIEAQSRVVIQDTCFADTPVGPTLERGKGILPIEPGLELGPGDLRLYGSRFFEQAVESVQLRGSVYTVHLLGALQQPEADLDGDGCVALLEAHAWARERVVEARAGYQVPQVRAQPQTMGNLALACSPGEPQNAVLAPPTDDRWTVSVTDREGQPVTGRSLPPGRYRLTVAELVPDDTGELSQEVRLDSALRVRAGQWVDVLEQLTVQKTLRWAELVGQGVATTEFPAGGLGARLGMAMPARGHSRWMLGAGGLYRIGPNELRASELTAQLGYLRTWSVPGSTSGMLLLGPALGLGPLWRTAILRDGTRNPHVGAYAELGLHGAYLRGPVQVSLEAGVRAVPLARDGDIPVHFAPLLTLGVGPGL
jgi:hypothetical protein